jgi:methyl-accepting chemotaxis protein
VDEVAAATRQSLTSVDLVARVSGELDGHADRLRRLVGGFTLRG